MTRAPVVLNDVAALVWKLKASRPCEVCGLDPAGQTVGVAGKLYAICADCMRPDSRLRPGWMSEDCR